MRRYAGIILTAALIGSCIFHAAAVDVPTASSAVLIESESGRVLYEKDSHRRRPIASITKLMTALVALESDIDVTKTVSIPREAVGIEGSSMYLTEGEELTLEALLYGLMLRSGNDAAIAIAIAICCCGGVEPFVEQMNRKAAELGMNDSHFENPNGLNADEHYSSAFDMAILGRACLQNPILSQIISTKTITIGNRSLKNHNKLLWQYDGCIGMKTGYTKDAGRTLVSAARRNGMTLIAVTLHDSNDWLDHMAMLDWGFAHYTPVELAHTGEICGYLPVDHSIVLFVPAAIQNTCVWPFGDTDELECSIHWISERLQAPVAAGQTLGVFQVFCQGEPVLQTDIIAVHGAAVNRAAPQSLWERILSAELPFREK